MHIEPNINEYLEALKSSRKFGPQVVFHKKIPATDATLNEFSPSINSRIRGVLHQNGINHLYSHQDLAINLIEDKNDVLVATPTASGKSLIYNLPVLAEYLKNRKSHALYLFPLKALAQDQLRILNKLSSSVLNKGENPLNNFAEIYDGDTSQYQRSKIRKTIPPVLMTNPDMLHLSILPFHDSWSLFFKTLKYVIIDEVHTYRGVFGSHMAWVLRRFKRIASYYGAEPTFILLSATIGNPEQFGTHLIGRKVQIVKKTGAPRTVKNMVLINPWDSAAYTASQMLEAALSRNLRTIVYTKSRKMTELIAMWTKPKLGKNEKKLSSYRAGFLPEERREIERKLSSGELLGVISTSALELGIDIGDLDLCILVGYPGSIMSTWQRAGRVGRGMKESAIIFIAGEDALDQHFMRNPDDFFSRQPELAALNPFNVKITRQHLHCAAAEIPLNRNEKLVSKSTKIQNEIDYLTKNTDLFLERTGEYWFASRKRPQRHVSLRGGGLQLSIIDQESGEIIGEVDSGRAVKETHPGAVYLHHSKILQVKKLDLEGREVLVATANPSFYTRPIVQKDTEILSTLKSKSVFGSRVSFGNLRVTEKVTGYKKINNGTGKAISTEPLDLPEMVIETEGIWIDIQEKNRKDLEDNQMHFMGAIHAVEHAMIAMFPLMVLCDRNDIGGISCPHHEQTGCASIFIYDGYSGGAGLNFEAFGLINDLLEQTLKTIELCPCETGCPSCVHSPKCGSGNRPIDKTASLFLLKKIIEQRFPAEFQDGFMTLPAPAEHKSPHHEISSKSIKNQKKRIHSSGVDLLPEHYGVFDLETKRSAQEVGGWNRAEKMGISVGVIYDSRLDGYVSYLENDMNGMVEHLKSLDLVVGFNNKRFDNRVLSAYTGYDLFQLPTLDILEEVHARLSYRLSLDRLAEHTLGSVKSGDGLQALKWFKEGKISNIVDYCRKDVKLTRNLFLYALENGFLLFKNKAGSIVRLPMDLSDRLEQILEERLALRAKEAVYKSSQ